MSDTTTRVAIEMGWDERPETRIGEALSELRFYAFGIYYLSSIQQGIQAGHCSVRLVRKYRDHGPMISKGRITPGQARMVGTWADKWETYICLSAGDMDGLQSVTGVVGAADFPWTTFSESKKSLGGIQTCVGVILPASVYEVNRQEDARGYYTYVNRIDNSIEYAPGHPYFELIDTLKSCKLAS